MHIITAFIHGTLSLSCVYGSQCSVIITRDLGQTAYETKRFIQLTTWEVESPDLVAPLFWLRSKVDGIMVGECGREFHGGEEEAKVTRVSDLSPVDLRTSGRLVQRKQSLGVVLKRRLMWSSVQQWEQG